MEHGMNDSHSRAGLRPEEKSPVSLKDIKWKRLLAYLKPHWRRMALAILSLLVSGGFGLAFPLVIVRLLDSVDKARQFRAAQHACHRADRHVPDAGGLSRFQSYLLAYIGEHIVFDLRHRPVQATSSNCRSISMLHGGWARSFRGCRAT